MNNGQIEIQGTFQQLKDTKLNFENILISGEAEVKEHIHNKFTREISNVSIQSSMADYDEEAGVEGVEEEVGLLGKKSSRMQACLDYLKSVGGWPSIASLALLLLLCQAATSSTDYWVAFWTKEEETRSMYVEFDPEEFNSSLAGNFTSTSPNSTGYELDYDDSFTNLPPSPSYNLTGNFTSTSPNSTEFDPEEFNSSLAGNFTSTSPSSTGYDELDYAEPLTDSPYNWTVNGTDRAPSLVEIDLSGDIANGTAGGTTVLLDRETSLYVYAGCVLLTVLLTIARSLLFFKACIAASSKLHSSLSHTMLRANMQFFHSVPSDKILSRFSSDFAIIDETLPRTLTEAFQIYLVIGGALVLMIITNYILIVPMVFVAAAIYKMRNIFTSTIQAMRRLEATTCGPVLTHLSTTLDGLATIRASGSQDVMSMDFFTYQDIHTSAFYLLFGSITAAAFWFDIVANIFVGCVSYSFLLLERGEGTPGADVGLAVSQSMVVIGLLHYGARCIAESSNHMTAVQRVSEYSAAQQEEGIDSPHIGKKPPATWPSRGGIQFDHLTLRYGNDSSPAVRNVTVNIEPGQKVGVVGHSGAGKTSLVSSLFRLVAFDGAVKIDEVDTRNIGLRDLRSRISILSDEPIVFSTSLRNNLDPYHAHSNDKLWNSLQEVELKDSERTLLIPIGVGGSNYSKGQKQLICLARALLTNNKILIMDETMDNVDSQTEIVFQSVIKNKLKDCTVLAMTHNVKTVIGSDRIMVMNAGSMVEFGHPHILLQNTGGHFYKMIADYGKSVAEELHRIARESYRLNEPEAETPEVEED